MVKKLNSSKSGYVKRNNEWMERTSILVPKILLDTARARCQMVDRSFSRYVTKLLWMDLYASKKKEPRMQMSLPREEGMEVELEGVTLEEIERLMAEETEVSEEMLVKKLVGE